MRVVVFLAESYFVALIVIFGFLQGVASERICDTKWIRLVYMMSCGKKKRESVWERNSTFSEPIPTNVQGALRYFKERDPNNPYFQDNGKFLYEILEEQDENRVMKKVESELREIVETNQVPKMNKEDEAQSDKGKTVFFKRLFLLPMEKNFKGIPGFPDQWDIEELTDKKINENHRREIDRLIEECCKTNPGSACNGNTFLGACK